MCVCMCQQVASWSNPQKLKYKLLTSLSNQHCECRNLAIQADPLHQFVVKLVKNLNSLGARHWTSAGAATSPSLKTAKQSNESKWVQMSPNEQNLCIKLQSCSQQASLQTSASSDLVNAPSPGHAAKTLLLSPHTCFEWPHWPLSSSLWWIFHPIKIQDWLSRRIKKWIKDCESISQYFRIFIVYFSISNDGKPRQSHTPWTWDECDISSQWYQIRKTCFRKYRSAHSTHLGWDYFKHRKNIVHDMVTESIRANVWKLVHRGIVWDCSFCFNFVSRGGRSCSIVL